MTWRWPRWDCAAKYNCPTAGEEGGGPLAPLLPRPLPPLLPSLPPSDLDPPSHAHPPTHPKENRYHRCHHAIGSHRARHYSLHPPSSSVFHVLATYVHSCANAQSRGIGLGTRRSLAMVLRLGSVLSCAGVRWLDPAGKLTMIPVVSALPQRAGGWHLHWARGRRAGGSSGHGGRLQPVLMRHLPPPAIGQNLGGGGAVWEGSAGGSRGGGSAGRFGRGGSAGGCGGGFGRGGGGFPRWRDLAWGGTRPLA